MLGINAVYVVMFRYSTADVRLRDRHAFPIESRLEVVGLLTVSRAGCETGEPPANQAIAQLLYDHLVLYLAGIFALTSALLPLGTLSVFHPGPFQCFARKTICPTW